ncbi:hypothetical protein CTAYLR_007497 [Chrysophaeum taylorii]|uniref:J domain-containing protein n=1 Tax=Chrysophaeum taylorii TaxID=2483200 RepID=A0AAD7UK11_9STRA|nr:hypothetical protein CTAYLR_007497 [Chrysophaeum taylorii]
MRLALLFLLLRALVSVVVVVVAKKDVHTKVRAEEDAVISDILKAHAEDDLYAVLRVRPTCSPKQLKKAYLNRARRVHPDVNSDMVHDAYEELASPEKRTNYDRERAERAAQKREMARKRRTRMWTRVSNLARGLWRYKLVVGLVYVVISTLLA